MGKRNPNGYGCVTKLKGHRSRPWVVKVTIYDETGSSRQVPVGYAATETEANILLARYNNNPWELDRETVTLVILYNRWLKIKFPKLGKASQSALKAAFKHCSKYYGVKYRALRAYQMQDCIDNCGHGASTQWAIKNLWGHLDRFAFEMDIIDKMYSQLTTAVPMPETTRQPFTSTQIDALWALEAEHPDKWVETVLVFLYTGYRLRELLLLKRECVDMTQLCMTAGLKTESGKNRIMPIHHRILPFITQWYEENNIYLLTENGKPIKINTYYGYWETVMKKIGADKTPHEARHTFETMLDNAKGNRKCIDLLMGHKSKDTGNRVYNHKTFQQLKDTVELLK